MADQLLRYDGHGSVRFLTDESGAITDRYDYDAYGTLLSVQGATPNQYLYAGEAFDSELGLYNLRARLMNPLTGRFWNADTYEGQSSDPQSLHKYNYTYGDPINQADPTGNTPSLSSLMCNLALKQIMDVALVSHAAAEGMRDEMARQNAEMAGGLRDQYDPSAVKRAGVWSGALAFGISQIQSVVVATLGAAGSAYNYMAVSSEVAAARNMLSAGSHSSTAIAKWGSRLPLATGAIVPYLEGPIGMKLGARLVHKLAGRNAISMNQSTVAIARVRLPDGNMTYYASASGGRLVPAQRQLLEKLGVPETNILWGSRAVTGFSQLENHAERKIIRNVPAGSKFETWGISWAGAQKSIPCTNCLPEVTAAGGAIQY